MTLGVKASPSSWGWEGAGGARRGSTASSPDPLPAHTQHPLAREPQSWFLLDFRQEGGGALSELFKGLITESWWFVFLFLC